MKSDLVLFSNMVYVKLLLAMKVITDFSIDTRNQIFLLDDSRKIHTNLLSNGLVKTTFKSIQAI